MAAVAARVALLTGSQAIVNQDSQTNKHHILGLPAEVRNRIFRFALLEADQIELSASSPIPPGLLSVSKQIREETLYLYYGENHFTIVMVDYDIQAVMPSFRVQNRHFKPHGKAGCGVVSFDCRGVPNWQNFVEWCRLVHNHKMFAYSVESDCTDERVISLAAIQDVILTMQDRAWSEVQRVLEGFRKLMVLQDTAWAT